MYILYNIHMSLYICHIIYIYICFEHQTPQHPAPKMSASKETSQAPAPPHPEDMCRNPKKEKGEINGLEMEMDCKWKWNWKWIL